MKSTSQGSVFLPLKWPNGSAPYDEQIRIAVGRHLVDLLLGSPTIGENSGARYSMELAQVAIPRTGADLIFWPAAMLTTDAGRRPERRP